MERMGDSIPTDEVQRHLALVRLHDDNADNSSGNHIHRRHLQVFSTAPIVSNKVKTCVSDNEGSMISFPAYGLLGVRLSTYMDGVQHTEPSTEDNLLYANINAPWSAFICGSQGAGKSHTLSCLLENSLFQDGYLGPNAHPLAGLVFHFDKHSGQAAAQICEAAYLASKGIKVEVFVSPLNFWDMKELYHLPTIPDDKQPKVRPLLLRDNQINIGNMRTLMNLDAQDGKIPLYMAMVNKVLRQMAIQQKGKAGIDYDKFKQELKKAKLTPSQNEHLDMRLQLLESFLLRTASMELKSEAGQGLECKAGSLTIIDLSCPFVSESDACMLFSICLSLFLGTRDTNGLVIALDEAHKFLTESSEAKGLTEDIIQVIRQQRHLAARVIIATQEPTLSPALLDLCNVTIVHRFQSQAWYTTLKNHLAALNRSNGEDRVFERIVDLENGEALLFCPTANLDLSETDNTTSLMALRSGYIKMQVRKRLTEDGGKSIMAADVGESV